MTGIVHTAGKYENGMQHCIVCGVVIVDDRGAMIQEGQRAPKGFPEGPVTVDGAMSAAFDDERFPHCEAE